MPDEIGRTVVVAPWLGNATTGELAATQLSPTAVVDELARVAPREVLVAPELLGDSVRAQVVAQWRERYKVASGTFGHRGRDVDVYFPKTTRAVRFEGEQATRLHDLGVLISEGKL